MQKKTVAGKGNVKGSCKLIDYHKPFQLNILMFPFLQSQVHCPGASSRSVDDVTLYVLL